MAIKVTVKEPTVGKTVDNKGHTYIHFGGDLKARFQALAIKAGYTRGLNDFGVQIFAQALAEAEQDLANQTKSNK